MGGLHWNNADGFRWAVDGNDALRTDLTANGRWVWSHHRAGNGWSKPIHASKKTFVDWYSAACDAENHLREKRNPLPMTLRRWAGLRHAEVMTKDYGHNRSDTESGCREVYRCWYWDENGIKMYGPVRRNPIDCMEAAKSQDEKRRARK